MNLDELANAIRSVSEEKDVQRLADHLMEWKQNKETAEELNHSIERNLTDDKIHASPRQAQQSGLSLRHRRRRPRRSDAAWVP